MNAKFSDENLSAREFIKHKRFMIASTHIQLTNLLLTVLQPHWSLAYSEPQEVTGLVYTFLFS